MHLLGSFITWLMPTLSAWFISFMTRKLAVAAAGITAFVAISAAFIVCIKTIVSYVIALAVLPSWMAVAVGMFVPSNFAVVFSNILAAQSCRWAYDKAMEKVKLISSAA